MLVLWSPSEIKIRGWLRILGIKFLLSFLLMQAHKMRTKAHFHLLVMDADTRPWEIPTTHKLNWRITQMFAVYRTIKETDSCLLLLNQQQQSNGLKTSPFFFLSLLLWKCQCCKCSLQEKWVDMKRFMTSMIRELPISQVRSSGCNPKSQNISYRYLEPSGLGKKTVNVYFRFTGPWASPHILEVCLASWL